MINYSKTFNIFKTKKHTYINFISDKLIFVILVDERIQKLAKQIFKMDPLIHHLGLIDLEGHILLDQSSVSPTPNEPDEDRMMFYYQVGLRRNRREHFNDVYGKTEYIHIVREKMQQIVVYMP